ncbi:unnamed protein product [Adineta ricciae]|nr:unnamed protein product [Adineta ricciae]
MMKRRVLKLRREKQIISKDEKYGGNMEFMGIQSINVDDTRYVIVIETKRNALGKGLTQLLLSLRSMFEINNDQKTVYGFVTTAVNWQLVTYDGQTWKISESSVLLSGNMEKQEDRWLKNNTQILDEGFSNLNTRFRQLLDHPSFRYKIRIDYSNGKAKSINELKQSVCLNKNQISSINLCSWINNNEIFFSFDFNSSYEQLERLVFSYIKPDIIHLLLPKLVDLPRLFSLIFETEYDLKHFGSIYRLVFNLQKLKYFKLKATDATDSNIDLSLPIIFNQSLSSIEHLIIDHPCTFQQLKHLLFHTPNVHHLKFLNSNDNETKFDDLSLVKLTNLSIEAYHMTFDIFETFLSHLNLTILKVLSLKVYIEDKNYLNAKRWEEIILTKIPNLEKFYLKYLVPFEDHHQPSIYTGKPNEFFSSFWFQRNWIFEIEIKYDNIIYSIHPLKIQWFDDYKSNEKAIYSFEEFARFRRVTLVDTSPELLYETLTIHDYLSHVSSVMQIDHLDIKEEIDFVKLYQILHSLNELDSLKLYKISISSLGRVTEEELTIFSKFPSRMSITKVCLEKICQIEESLVIMAFCPLIKQFQINSLQKIEIESFLRTFLTHIKVQAIQILRLLCICVSTADDEMINKLKQTIENENLLLDFTLNRIKDKIYLKWK